MAAALTPNPKFQGFTSDGDPLNGGKLFTYVTGTSTPKSTYPTKADAEAGTNANANPVVLDSRGEANVWLAGDALYRFTLTTSADAAVWGPIDGIGNILEASGGSALIGFIQAGTGAAARTMQAKARETISLTDYDTVANALAAAAGKTLVIKTGETATFSADTTIGATVSVVVENGGLISVDSAKTLTIQNSLQAGLYQIFTGAGSVVIHPGSVEAILPQWWGASPSASAATNTAAIQASLDAMYGTASYVLDGSWRLPPGDYAVNDEVEFPSTTTAEATRCKLIFDGRLVQSSGTANTIKFNLLYYCTILGIKMIGPGSAATYPNGASGVLFNKTVANCEIGIEYVYGGFTYSVKCSSGGVYQFNEFHLGVLRGAKYGFYIDVTNAATNYFNANSIFGGDFANPYYTPGDGSWGIYFTAGVSSYSNRIYNPCFANLNGDMHLNKNVGLLVSNPYFDTPQADEVAADLTAVVAMTWVHGYSSFDDLDFITSSDTRANVFIGKGKYTASGPTMDVGKEGLDFSFTGTTEVAPHHSSLGYAPTTPALSFTDHLGTSQILNKSGSGDTSAPATGTYEKGAIVWNTTTIAGGQVMGYMCKTYGTAGTLAAVTADTTNGSPTIVVNDATNLKYGMHITVAGATLTGVQIIGINGTSVRVSANAAATLTGAAVSYYAPTWQALPVF